MLQRRYPKLDARLLNLDDPDPAFAVQADIVYCYGTLYHLEHPARALAYLAARTKHFLLLETCVSPGDDEEINPVEEELAKPSQGLRGRGCRPTRSWVYTRLREHFEHAYLTTTQPWHEEFPLVWEFEPDSSVPIRGVRASRPAPRRRLAAPS